MAVASLSLGTDPVSAQGPAQGAPAAHGPTFNKDVAPIMFSKCATCHREGEVAPMSLLTYEQVRPWARAIKSKVISREMPPWGADPRESLPMRNDMSLSEAQIATLVAWVDAGAPRGNPADLPPVPTFTTGWTYGSEPDAILEMPVEFEIPAEGELGVQMFYSKVPWNEDRFAEVVELRPGNAKVVHHAGIFFVDIPEGTTLVNGRIVGPDGKIIGDRGSAGLPSTDSGLPGSSKLLSWVPGRGLDRHRPNVGKRIPAGKYINWQLHYNPTGKVEKDRSRLGIWFNKVPVTHEVLIRQAGDPLATTKGGLSLYRAEGEEVEYKADPSSTRRSRTTPNIPPYAENWSLTGITPVTEDITLYAMSPHMHLRGKSLKWVVTYPDGRDQTILSVPRFDFNWQFNYELAEPLKIPAGSKITGIGFYDNSPKNKWNPAPHLEVYWSEQSWDEMYQPFTEYSVDSQDLTKQKAGPTTSAPPQQR
ncbi:MAG: cytochrome c [Acidobacteria bacterium]|nr:cytochrome c [Acidobacteriota bacterium]